LLEERNFEYGSPLECTHLVVRSLKDVLIQCFTLYGNSSSAEQTTNELVELLEKELGPEHLEMLACRSNLAQTYRNQGQWKKPMMCYFRS
jgi:hypothetical protein